MPEHEAFVVVGEQGEYSDRDVWVVCVTDTEAKAQEIVVSATKQSRAALRELDEAIKAIEPARKASDYTLEDTVFADWQEKWRQVLIDRGLPPVKADPEYGEPWYLDDPSYHYERVRYWISV